MATYDLTSVTPGEIQASDVLNVPYSGAAVSITLPAGKYKLECWGAQGGSYNSSYGVGGKGGYSAGVISLKKPTKVYLYAGGAGSYYTTSTYTSQGAGGFNGGGNVGYYGGSGGGGTDIRIGKDDLYARVIVAGGGGGAYSYNATYKANGGAAGGASGTAGSYYSSSYSAFAGGGASQTAGGSAGTGSSANYNGKAGSFGNGGATGYKYNSTSYYSNGAGGGGWYGGGAAGNYSSANRGRASGGGGGSGFVWTGQNAPVGYSLGKEHYLTETSLLGGTSSFAAPGGGSETGHSGNGYIRITVIALAPEKPKNFRQIGTQFEEIDLSWGASSEAVNYNLYRDGVFLASTTSTSYTDKSVSHSSTYKYGLSVFNGQMDSEEATLIAKTKFGYKILLPTVVSASFSVNPVIINSSTLLSATIVEESYLLEPDKIYSGELFSGEV